MEYKVGDIMPYNNKSLLTRRGDDCNDCFFYDGSNCHAKGIKCAGIEREDGESVVFSEVRATAKKATAKKGDKRGGARPNAGRKSDGRHYGVTITVRISREVAAECRKKQNMSKFVDDTLRLAMFSKE